MGGNYLSVEYVAKTLGIHPKTIQRYIREGKLPAVKVGKAWRISGHDLSVFLEANKTGDERVFTSRKITSSSVIDIQVLDEEEALRIINLLSATMNAKPDDLTNSSLRSQYIEAQSIVRVSLWGEIDFVKTMLDMIVMITKEEA